MRELILVSRREEDLRFAKNLCTSGALGLKHLRALDEIRNLATDSLLLCDQPDLERSELSFDPNLVWEIGDHCASKYSASIRTGRCSNYIKRSSDGSGDELGAQLITQLASGFVGQTQTTKFLLKRSADISIAVPMLEEILAQQALPERLMQKISQGVNELLVNAIFDAPLSPIGERYRITQPRGSAFELNKSEEIQFEILISRGFGAVSVIDTFGSFETERLFERALARNEPGAGIGIYMVLLSGLSVSFAFRPGSFTRATIFFPLARTMAEFKHSSQFFSLVKSGSGI